MRKIINAVVAVLAIARLAVAVSPGSAHTANRLVMVKSCPPLGWA